jgi:DNA-binding response OmpR family regulator
MIRSLLVVDGDPDVSGLLRDALEREGFRVSCAATGREALHLLRRARRPSCLLVDPLTSQTDGEDLIGDLQADAAFAKIPIVVVSTMGRDLVPPSVTRILRKPFALDDLLEAVRGLT